MGVVNQCIKDSYAIYNGDCIQVMSDLESESVHLSIYSPPFAGLYNYSSIDNDLSNSADYNKFFEHYEYVVSQIARLTMPGRMTAVHCADTPSGNSGLDYIVDFPGDIIRQHASFGFRYIARYCIWKEPLTVRNRTMTKSLAHKSVVEDSSRCSAAGADYLLIFRRHGKNETPISHPVGLTEYAGERVIPRDLLRYKESSGKQADNRYSHWIWRQYASAFWDDIRLNRVLPYKKARDAEDEKHIHALQLDVVDRALTLWSNPGEVVLTPFMGVGSEVYASIVNGRRAIGIELKETYYRQAMKNMGDAENREKERTAPLFADVDPPEVETVA